MSDPDLQDKLGQPIVVLQIIVGAMVLGLVGFLGMVVALRAGGQAFAEPAATGSLVTYIAIGYAVAVVLVRAMIPSVVASVGRQKILRETVDPAGDGDAAGGDRHGSPSGADDVDGLLGLFRAKTIITAALFEGAGLFVVVAYMIEGTRLALLGAIVLAVLLACHFPTRTAAVGWIEDQRRLLEQERMLSR